MSVRCGSNLSDGLTDFSIPSVLQIFVGKIPRDLFEDELVPLFEKAGPIWDLRLMMDPLSGLNRGYAFLTFCTKEAAQEAVKLVRQIHLVKFQETCGWVVIDMGVASRIQPLIKYSIPVFLLSV